MPRQRNTSFHTPRQPPTPLISFRVSPHGVSGYATTGVGGAFNVQHASGGIFHNNLDPASSRYDIQSSTHREQGTGNYSQLYAIGNPAPQTTGAFTSEPVWGAAFATTASAATRNQLLQTTAPSTSASRLQAQARHGFLGHDMYLQYHVPTMDAGVSQTRPHGDIVSPVQPIRLNFRPTPPPRQDNQPSGTVNNEGVLPGPTPGGQATLHDINDAHTPQPVTAGYSAPGTHPAHGPSPSPAFDGSWTLDILPGGQGPPGLSDLPPPADIPVQTYSGTGPRNTSIYYTRPSGGKLFTHTQAVAEVPVFA